MKCVRTVKKERKEEAGSDGGIYLQEHLWFPPCSFPDLTSRGHSLLAVDTLIGATAAV